MPKRNELVTVEVVLNGWPKDEAIFDSADAIVFYMDGGRGHELVQEQGRRLKMAQRWIDKGVGIGFMHYGVEVVADQAGPDFMKFVGGYYENSFSCNPIWEPQFEKFPEHPVTRGVKPFQIKDEWYFNIRFFNDLSGNEPANVEGTKFTPILLASPSTKVRNGPYVYPAGPYPHIQANENRVEAMMWVVEHPNGSRGFGFTGGHFHDNWANDSFRKVILNAFVWLAKAEVPENGIVSQVNESLLNANLDPKKK